MKESNKERKLTVICQQCIYNKYHCPDNGNQHTLVSRQYYSFLINSLLGHLSPLGRVDKTWGAVAHWAGVIQAYSGTWSKIT